MENPNAVPAQQPAQPPAQPPARGGEQSAAPGMDEGIDPDMQAKYEDLHAQMNLIIDDPKRFQSVRKALAAGQEAGMLVEQAAQTVVSIINRLEKEVGPIEDEILIQLAEDLVTGVTDRFGFEMSTEEETQTMAAAVGLWQKANPDRVDVQGNQQFLQQHMGELEAMAQEKGRGPGGEPKGPPPEGKQAPKGLLSGGA